MSINAAIETLDSTATQPMSIDATEIGDDSWRRWAVTGTTSSKDTEDAYMLDLTGWAGQTIDVVLAGNDTNRLANATLKLIGPDGTTVLATASQKPLGVAPSNFDQGILDFEVPADGVYSLRLSVEGAVEYSIAVKADVAFDTESRNNADSPRQLEPGGSAMGYLSPESPLLFVVEPAFPGVLVHTVNATSGKIVNTFPAPVGSRSSYAENLAFDGSRLYYTAGGRDGEQTVYVLDGRDGTPVDTFEAVETTGAFQSLGLAYLDGKLYVADVESSARAEIDVHDALTGEYERSFASPVVLGLGGDHADGMLYGVDPITYEIVRIDPHTGAVVKTMPSGVGASQGTAVLGGDGILARFIPEDSGAKATAAGSFGAYETSERHVEWLFGETDEDHGTSHVCATGYGPVLYNDDPDVIPPATDRISPDAQEPLALDEVEGNDVIAMAQPVPLGFSDNESTAVLVSATLSSETDMDYYAVQLNEGDVLSVRVSGDASWAEVEDYRGEMIIGSEWAYSGSYPADSPLFGNSRVSLAFIAEAPGTYYVGIRERGASPFNGTEGEYFLDLEVVRPYLESQPVSTHQILYLDFDGCRLG